MSLVAIAALVGVGGALAFTPSHKTLANKIFGQRAGTSGAYSYANKPGTPTGSCLSNTGSVCTFSSTATAAYFNTHNTSTFPAVNADPGAGVLVSYTATSKIYR